MPTLPKVHVLPDSDWLPHSYLKICERSANLAVFTHHANQLIRLLLQSAAQFLPYTNDAVTTLLGDLFSGKALTLGICGVSVIRAGESMEAEFHSRFQDQPIKNIIVVNVLASPFGIQRLAETWPTLTIITSSIEIGMTESAFMRPGIGDFGDRYFGTYPDVHHE